MADPELLLADLVDADDEGTLLEFLLTTMAADGMPVTDWNSGGVALTLTRADAKAQAEQAALVRDIAKGGIFGLSKGKWLTLLALSRFSLTRQPAIFAVVHVRLVCAGGAGPFTITPGQLRIATPAGLKYSSSNAGNVSLSSGGTADLDFQAQSPGQAYNLTLESPFSVETPLVGVTFELLETFAGSGSCMTTPGEDEESDDALEPRCAARWATLGVEKTHDAYAFLARDATDADGVPVPGVTKVFVDDTNPDGPGTIRIYLAGDAGGIADSQTISDVNDYVQARKGLCAVLVTQGAVNDAVTVTATIKCRAERIADAQAQIATGLQALQASLAIADGNGAALDPVGKVYASRIEALLKDAPGVVDVTLTAPSVSYLPAKGHIALLTYSLSGGSASITFTTV